MKKPKKLSNGMRYHLIPFSGTDAATILVLVKVGSRYEPVKLWGASHYIEHLMFKGTKKRPSTIDISKTLDRFGAQYNAYTGKDLTGYYVKIASEKLPIAIDLLHDMIFNSLYEAKEMKREKQVIIEEIKMYEENPIMHIDDLLEQAMFKGNTLGLEIAGTPKSMLAMKRKDVLAYRDTYYVPSEMVIVVAGNIPKDTEQNLKKTFGKVKENKELPAQFETFANYQEHQKPKIKRQYKELEQIQIALGFPMPGRNHKDIPAIKLLANILGGTMSSRLFIEVRERKGLCYTIRAAADSYHDIGSFVIRAGLDAKRLDLAMKTIFKELEKMKKSGVTTEELRHAKDRLEGGMKLRLENSSAQAEFYGRQELFMDQVLTPNEKLDLYKRVTKKDILRVANEILNTKKLSIAAIGPYKTDAALLKYFAMLS